ncbi:MAG TPA: heterodisulfide reductase-related iron-sulfur binding cluster, partial [Gemmatimonadaceae bacterium]|nr:heterodisulfide reductase-related iron-sulfur binding cluster [Gemmatimonadaceae bacterium]
MTSPTRSAAPCAIPGTPLAEASAGIDACVHCGFCLQACPTYLTLEDENDSPRGRIVLMHALVEGTLPIDDPDVRTHIDRCLGCRACETACPSGVPYGHLLEATRATLTARRPNPPVARAILFAFARPMLLSLAMLGGRLARALRISSLLARLPGRFGFAMAMLEATRVPVQRSSYSPGGDGARGSATLLTGCVMEGLFAGTNRATERTLAANDYAIVHTHGQRCCGALHAHAGDADAARKLARHNIAAFERSGADYVVTNAAGCGAMMKEYEHLLDDDPAWRHRAAAVSARVRDVSELLAEAGPRPGGALDVTVTYDAPCHLLHAQRVATPPLRVLGVIPGLTLVPLEGSEHCCGSAGIYNLVEPEVSDTVLAPKLARIADTRAALVATGNPGCLMQIGAGLHQAGSDARVVHPVDLLDASY